jgi:hypothetical protein
VQRQLDVLQRIRPESGDQGQVALLDLAVAHRSMHAGQCAALQRDQQHPGGFTVEAVHQFQHATFRQLQPQLLDHPA